MRTIGAGARKDSGRNVEELETENNMLREANTSARERIHALEQMLDESRKEAAGLQARLDEGKKQKSSKEKDADK